MDKTAIRNFAIEARKILMKSAVTEAGFYGITKEGCAAPVQKGSDFEVYQTLAGTENRIYGDDIKRRANLVKAIQEQGFDQVIEETAYTWFNRIIAIRFMEVNNYLPTRVRVLSSETGSGTPDIITQADTVELNLTANELDRIQTAKRENKYDEAFRLLFIKQCNELNEILPGLFEKTNDYMELLLKITYTGDGVIRMLVDSILEDNFNVETEGQVEIIGWMYQYYNTELKDDTFAKLKKNVKITKERIPAATQLFTPDWIVRYMVENALGRVWIEHLRAVDPTIDEKAKAEEFGWKYYLPEAEQEADVASQLVEIRKSYRVLTPQDITCIDPCMGSGHILVYMFDVLMDIYRSEGFSEREAVFDILEKNIRGLDIDRRAYQLSYFALMMKARGYNRIFFRGRESVDGERVQAVPQVFAIEESNNINRNQLQYFGKCLSEIEKNDAINQLNGLLDQLMDAKEYGSILNMETYNWDLLNRFISEYYISGQMDLGMVGIDDTRAHIVSLIAQAKVLGSKYHVVSTNPPYMGNGGMSDKLLSFVKKMYPNSKSDMFAIFIEKCSSMCQRFGFQSMITQHTWMFLSGYEKLRLNMINQTVINMAHLGARAFEEIGGEVVQTTTWVQRKVDLPLYKGCYSRLVNDNSQREKERAYLNKQNMYRCEKDAYNKIPGCPFVYWIERQWISVFNDNDKLDEHALVRRTLQTGNSEKFMRIWFEVDKDKTLLSYCNREEALKSNAKWFMFSYGGKFRKWYGNLELVVNWENEGSEIKKTGKAIIPSEEMYFNETLAWSKVTTNDISLRYYDQGILPGDASACIFNYDGNLKLLLAYMNSSIARDILRMISPSMNFPTGTVSQVPIFVPKANAAEILALTEENIELSREEWNMQETSWDFQEHPMLKYKGESIKESYKNWMERKKNIIDQLKRNEERIDELFMEEMGIGKNLLSTDPTTPNQMTVLSEKEAVCSLLLYFVGCMFGRYDVMNPGLKCTSSKMDIMEDASFKPDKDNIIPITEDKYFDDDIVSLTEKLVAIVWGEANKENNLKYIAEALYGTDDDYMKKIRKYYLESFYDYQLSIYSNKNLGKRPIYWMFTSGDSGAFKCLSYVHRYNRDLVGLVRSDYLIKTQNDIENSLRNAEYVLQTSASSVDKALATKKRDKYIKQLSELKLYFQALSHMALQRIEIDIDDGIKHNYSLFQGIEISNEGEKNQTIDLLAKI